MINRHILILIILFLYTCTNSKEESELNGDESIIFITEKTVYSISDTVVYTIQNQSDSSFFLQHCCGSFAFWIDKKENELWARIGDVNMLCITFCDATPNELQPNYTYQDLFQISDPGTYQLILPYGIEPLFTSINDSIISNSFIVE